MAANEGLTVDEVAERAKTTPSTVRRWLRSQRLAGQRAGGGGGAGRSGWRVSEPDLQRFLDSRPELGPEPRAPQGGTMTGYERGREG